MHDCYISLAVLSREDQWLDANNAHAFIRSSNMYCFCSSSLKRRAQYSTDERFVSAVKAQSSVYGVRLYNTISPCCTQVHSYSGYLRHANTCDDSPWAKPTSRWLSRKMDHSYETDEVEPGATDGSKKAINMPQLPFIPNLPISVRRDLSCMISILLVRFHSFYVPRCSHWLWSTSSLLVCKLQGTTVNYSLRFDSTALAPRSQL